MPTPINPGTYYAIYSGDDLFFTIDIESRYVLSGGSFTFRIVPVDGFNIAYGAELKAFNNYNRTTQLEISRVGNTYTVSSVTSNVYVYLDSLDSVETVTHNVEINTYGVSLDEKSVVQTCILSRLIKRSLER